MTDVIKQVSMNKDLIIIVLLLCIIFIAFYDKIIPIIIQFNFDYINNLVMFIPITLLTIFILLSIFSKFKIFSKDALFRFNHTFVNNNKYNTIINKHIDKYRQKIMNITVLHNKELLKISKLKEKLANNQQYFMDIKTIMNNLKLHCNKVSNSHNDKLNIYTDKVNQHINKMSDKASKIWNTY